MQEIQMKCKTCEEEVKCPLHGDKFISKERHDMDNTDFYWCDECVKGGATLLSICHWCEKTGFPEFTKSLVKEGYN